MTHAEINLLTSIKKSYLLRVSILLAILLCTYLTIFITVGKIFTPRSQDYYVALAAGVAAMLIGASMASHHWIRFLAPIRVELHDDGFAAADVVLQELAARAGFSVELRVIKAKRVFIYSSGVTDRMVLISTTALDGLSPIALRGVLAHEVAHMVLTHAIKNACALASFFALRIALQISGVTAFAMVMWLLLYLRSREYEADKVAALMVGKEPVLVALHEVKALTKMKEFSRLTEFLISTHPSYGRRELALRATQF